MNLLKNSTIYKNLYQQTIKRIINLCITGINFLHTFFTPFAPIYLYFRKVKKKEDPVRFKEKLSKINLPRDDGFLIWFHVASVGEANEYSSTN